MTFCVTATGIRRIPRSKFGLTLEQTLPSFEKPGPEALLLFGIEHTITARASKKKGIYSRDRGKLVLN